MLSVIIPIYNTGEYLNKCISSVVSQTYQDLEIILVNDCSTDKNTIQVIQKWIKKDSRIILIDKEKNEGVDKARISGIYSSHGDYLAFVDSDDWMPLDAFEFMMKKAVETGADLVKGNNLNMWFNGCVKKVSKLQDTSFIEREILHEELIDKYYLSFFGVNIIPVTLWGAVYRRSLFLDANIQASGLKFGEDLVMTMSIFPFVQKYYHLEKVVYCYRQGLPTMSGKYLNKWLSNFNGLYKIKMRQLENFVSGNDEHYRTAVYYQNVELVNYLRSFVNGCNIHRKSCLPESIEELQQELKDPIYRNVLALMRNERMKVMAKMLEDGDASAFWTYVTDEHKQELTFKMKMVECFQGMISNFG